MTTKVAKPAQAVKRQAAKPAQTAKPLRPFLPSALQRKFAFVAGGVTYYPVFDGLELFVQDVNEGYYEVLTERGEKRIIKYDLLRKFIVRIDEHRAAVLDNQEANRL